jgi:hypothetical protein
LKLVIEAIVVAALAARYIALQPPAPPNRT